MKPQLNQKIKDQFLIDFGKNLKKIREGKGMSQVDLAMKINGDSSKISKAERGIYEFKMSTLLIVAEALGVDAGRLFSFENIDKYQEGILSYQPNTDAKANRIDKSA